MVNELLVGLLIQAKTFFHLDLPITRAVAQTIVPPSTDLLPPVTVTKPTKKKAKPELKSATLSPVTASKVLEALNNYRRKNGVGELQIDRKLQSYAQSRADYLKSIGKLDKHAGHRAFMQNDGFGKLGFSAIAENQSYNFKGEAKGLVESFYAKSPGHNKNQLNGENTHVGIGINGPFTDLVFGGRKR